MRLPRRPNDTAESTTIKSTVVKSGCWRSSPPTTPRTKTQRFSFTIGEGMPLFCSAPIILSYAPLLIAAYPIIRPHTNTTLRPHTNTTCSSLTPRGCCLYSLNFRQGVFSEDTFLTGFVDTRLYLPAPLRAGECATLRPFS